MADPMGISGAMTGIKDGQETAIQLKMLRMAMDDQSQAMSQLLQGASGTAKTVPMNPNVGKNLDMYA